jgi:MAP/microtubule affinity-regulating kinase
MSSKTENSLKSFKCGNIGYYNFERNLGEGNFAKVKLAVHTITKEKVAIKIIDKTKLDEINSKKLFREVRIMKLLNHAHIVKLYEVIDTPDELYLIMEYVKGGEIFDYIVAHGKMKEDVAKKHFRQIVLAVDHCHRLKIIHRDLKAENILLDDKMNVKVADFGFSTQFRDDAKLNTWCGSPPYACPELYLGQEYFGPEVDIWSLGVILFVLVCGSLPFDASNLPKLRAKILAGKFKVPYHMSKECESLIRRMIVVDPTQRISLSDLKDDTWLNDGDKSQQNISTQLLIGPSMHERIIKELDKLGLNREDVESALKENIYNHVQACYYLIADREDKKDKEGTPISIQIELPKSLAAIPTDSKMDPTLELPEINEEESGPAPTKLLDPKLPDVRSRAVSATARRGRRCSEDATAAALAAAHAAAATKANEVRIAQEVAKQETVKIIKTRSPSNSPPATGRGRSSTVTAASPPVIIVQNEPSMPQTVKPSLFPSIAPKRRDRSKTVGKPETVSMDMPEADVSSKSLNKNPDEPRSLRFTFSVSTTSTKDTQHILSELHRVLNESQIEFKQEKFVTTCVTPADIEFEIEICKIPRLSVNGLRIKRLTGNSWEYKNIISELVNKMDL